MVLHCSSGLYIAMGRGICIKCIHTGISYSVRVNGVLAEKQRSKRSHSLAQHVGCFSVLLDFFSFCGAHDVSQLC